MPTVSMSLPDITQSVFRPVMFAVADQVKEATNIPKDIPIWFLNEEGELQSAGSSIDNKTDRLARNDSRERFTIFAEESFSDDLQVTDYSGEKGNVPVFMDRLLDFWLAPAYVSSTATLRLEFHTKSKETARRWRDTVAARYLQGRYAMNHQVTYSFNMPLPAYGLIEEIWKKRNTIGGYGDTLLEYVHKCMTNQLQIISNETGSRTQYTIACKQDRIQGFFNFTNSPDKIEYDRDAGLYITKFEYTFTYQRPATFTMNYPILVHQQMLANKYTEFVNKGPKHDDRQVHRDQFLWGMQQLETSEIMSVLKPRYPFMRIPEQDDFQFTYFYPGTAMYLMVLLQQTEGQSFAFNLKELGNYCIDPDILDFLEQGEYKHIGVQGKSIFHMDVYRGNSLCDFPAVRINEKLDVDIVAPVDVRKQYRVRCAVYTDLSMIDRAALDRLMAHPKAFQKVFAAINQLLAYDTGFQKLGDQRRIHPWQLTRIYEAVMGQGTCNIYTGAPINRIGQVWGNRYANTQNNLLDSIPEHILQQYRTLRKGRHDVQILGIVAYNSGRDLAAAKAQGF